MSRPRIALLSNPKSTGNIAQLSRIVTLHDLNINKSTGKDAALAMDAIVKTYRYLDDEELSAQKKKAKEAKK